MRDIQLQTACAISYLYLYRHLNLLPKAKYAIYKNIR